MAELKWKKPNLSFNTAKLLLDLRADDDDDCVLMVVTENLTRFLNQGITVEYEFLQCCLIFYELFLDNLVAKHGEGIFGACSSKRGFWKFLSAEGRSEDHVG